jgi:hypothetical protein
MGPWRSGKRLRGMVLALAGVAGAALGLPTGLAELLISQACRTCHQQRLSSATPCPWGHTWVELSP